MTQKFFEYIAANINVPLGANMGDLKAFLVKELHTKPENIIECRLSRRSVDARDKGNVHFVVSIDFTSHVPLHAPRGIQLNEISHDDTIHAVKPRVLAHRPMVVGLGPAGLFAALTLARLGLEPVVIERGRDVEARRRDIEVFSNGGELDENSNIQFGEGGAGAFSDGKLNTGISDKNCRQVLNDLYEAGAPEDILYDAKPHIGTDRLPGVVRNVREKIRLLGGTVLHETRLTDIRVENGHVRGAVIEHNGERSEIETDDIILAIGHSSRDTLEMLLGKNANMERKPFSIGARIEHSQKLINISQYGRFADSKQLGAADYKLNVRTSGDRGVYTFCMCPGGTVVPAASERGGICTNGMSTYARDGENSNSALLVSVLPEDFGEGDVLAGVRFQREWERRAYKLSASYRAPAQLVADFSAGRASKGPGGIMPTYKPGVIWTSLDEILPRFVTAAMREALPMLDRRLHGFNAPDAVLTGPETRSSSPVRILRDSGFESNIRGLYPCGEGAGYAGGILSAAVDGIRCANALAEEKQ